MHLDILVRVDNLLSFLSFFLILPGTAFIEFGNILFLKYLGRLSCFWKVLIGKMIIRIIWIPRCLRVCIIPRAAINSWECRLFALQLFQRKRPEQSECLLFIDIIIYFNFVMSLLSNCFMMNLKLRNACHHWVYQFCLLLRQCRRRFQHLIKCFWGMGSLELSHHDDDATISHNNENCINLWASSPFKGCREEY